MKDKVEIFFEKIFAFAGIVCIIIIIFTLIKQSYINLFENKIYVVGNITGLHKSINTTKGRSFKFCVENRVYTSTCDIYCDKYEIGKKYIVQTWKSDPDFAPNLLFIEVDSMMYLSSKENCTVWQDIPYNIAKPTAIPRRAEK